MANWEVKIERGECQCNSFFSPPYYKCSGLSVIIKVYGWCRTDRQKEALAAAFRIYLHLLC